MSSENPLHLSTKLYQSWVLVMLYRRYRQISDFSKMLFNQATSIGVSTRLLRFCIDPSPNSRQNHFHSSSCAIFRPIQADRNLHSLLIHNSSYNRWVSSSRVVRCKAGAVGTGGVSTTEKKRKRIRPSKNKNRTEISQAQKDLCDYFHNTRGYSFTDADYISKNASKFLGNLLSKLKKDGSFNQSIARYLRFQPINEFEPFFESIGVPPIKHKHVLPKNLIYLCDDPVFLENYYVLCNYGVLRSKTGKIYLEAPEVFRYGEGVLVSKLRIYENSGLSRAAIVKLITCCPHILVGEVNVDVIRVYEKLSNLGVDFDLVIQCLSDKCKYNWNRVSEMLTFLYRMGFDKQALATLIMETPVFVFHESGKTIYMLVGILIKLGLQTDGILNLFVKNPHLLVGSFVKNLGSAVIFLTEIGMQPGDIARIISTDAHILGSSPCDSSDSVLHRLSLSSKSLSDTIKADPSKFTSLACTRNAAEPLHNDEELFLKEKTEFLLKLGFTEFSDEMAKVVSKVRGRGDKLKERFECIVNSGLDYHDVVKMIKMAPRVLNQSVDALTQKIDYLTSELNYPVESLVEFPTFLCYKMDRVKLRCEMMRWVAEQGLVPKRSGEKFALSYVLVSSEKRFLKQFVDVNPEWRKHYEMLKKSIIDSDVIAD